MTMVVVVTAAAVVIMVLPVAVVVMMLVALGGVVSGLSCVPKTSMLRVIWVCFVCRGRGFVPLFLQGIAGGAVQPAELAQATRSLSIS